MRSIPVGPHAISTAKLARSNEILSTVHERIQSVEGQFRTVTGCGFDALTESQQPATWQRLMMLSPSEIESFWQRSKQANVEVKEYLAFLKANKQQTVAKAMDQPLKPTDTQPLDYPKDALSDYQPDMTRICWTQVLREDDDVKVQPLPLPPPPDIDWEKLFT